MSKPACACCWLADLILRRHRPPSQGLWRRGRALRQAADIESEGARGQLGEEADSEGRATARASRSTRIKGAVTVRDGNDSDDSDPGRLGTGPLRLPAVTCRRTLADRDVDRADAAGHGGESESAMEGVGGRRR
jgi:hypothetical protein